MPGRLARAPIKAAARAPRTLAAAPTYLPSSVPPRWAAPSRAPPVSPLASSADSPAALPVGRSWPRHELVRVVPKPTRLFLAPEDLWNAAARACPSQPPWPSAADGIPIAPVQLLCRWAAPLDRLVLLFLFRDSSELVGHWSTIGCVLQISSATPWNLRIITTRSF
jgi:hypothetical protein